jgi:hypothetical protein
MGYSMHDGDENVCRILDEKPEGKRLLGRAGCRWGLNIWTSFGFLKIDSNTGVFCTRQWNVGFHEKCLHLMTSYRPFEEDYIDRVPRSWLVIYYSIDLSLAYNIATTDTQEWVGILRTLSVLYGEQVFLEGGGVILFSCMSFIIEGLWVNPPSVSSEPLLKSSSPGAASRP